MTLEVGARAPEFSLKGTDGRTYALAERLGAEPAVIAPAGDGNPDFKPG